MDHVFRGEHLRAQPACLLDLRLNAGFGAKEARARLEVAFFVTGEMKLRKAMT